MIKVQENDFNLDKEIKDLLVGDQEIGGISLFVGVVRDFSNGEKLTGMRLEHYPGMTEKALKSIEDEALKRWSLNGILIIHRFGFLKPGDQIVLVCAASAHRQAAIEACNFLIDWLKTKAPFWKYEEKLSGGEWVTARKLDEIESVKWER